MTEWWTPMQGTFFGAFGGAGIGVLLGTFGAIVGVYAARGKLGQWAVSVVVAVTALGVVTCVAGMIALAIGQPYHVYYPLMLIGGIASLVCGCNISTVRNAVRSCQQRKLAAAELRRG
ncbi:MAG: hypothetical protein ACKVS9_00705 [Phycisphaerae bacterium]